MKTVRHSDLVGRGSPAGSVTSHFTYQFHLPPTPAHSPAILSTLALIKSSPTLDSVSPLGLQLHFVQLSNASAPSLLADDGAASGPSTAVATPTASGTPYDGLHSLVHWGVAPWFDAYVNSKQALSQDEAVSKKGSEPQMGERADSLTRNANRADDKVYLSQRSALPSWSSPCYISNRTSRSRKLVLLSIRPSEELSLK